MAMASSKLLFLFLFFLLPLFTSGTLVGFSYHAKGNAATSLTCGTISLLNLNKVSAWRIRVFAADRRVLSCLSNAGVPADIYLSQTHVLSLMSSNSSVTSWLKTQITDLHVNIRSIIVSTTCDDLQRQQDHDLLTLLSALESIHSGLSRLEVDRDVKVSAAFSLSVLNNLGGGGDLQRICSFIKKAGSSIVVETSIEGEMSMGDELALEMIERANLAVSVLSCTDVPILLTVTIQAVPSPTQVAELSNKVSKHMQNEALVKERVTELYAEVPLRLGEDDGGQKREVLEKHDEIINPPANTVFPTTPVSTTPITIPPDTPFVTVPATNPVTVTPTNPANTPVPLPATTPVNVPSTYPANSPLPITNPVTTPPVTNPVTTYPAPAANVPVNPPATTNAPGQSWCVAKTGAPESSVQAALDYACGIGGADCAQIQQSGSCYNPNTLQNHASFAFNSYYQKNPSPTSCDFGGTAAITNTNPSSGSCIFPSSASSVTPPSTSSIPPPSTSSTAPPQIPTPTPVTTPITTPTPTPTTSSSSGAGIPGSGTPPMVLNSSDPASGTPTVFGSEVPPSVNTSTTSISATLQPFLPCILLVTSFVTHKLLH